MICDKTNAVFCLYDGELHGGEREAAEIHLANCAECRQTITDWTTLTRVAFRPQDKFTSPDLSSRVISRIKMEKRPGRGFLQVLRPYVTIPRLAAAGAMAIALVLFISRPFLASRNVASIEGTAFVAELVGGDIPETDSYGHVSEYIFGS